MKAFNQPWNADPGTVFGQLAMLDGLFGRESTTYSTSDGGTTVSGANIVKGIWIRTAASGAVTETTDTAANIVAACSGALQGGNIPRGGNVPIGWATVVRVVNQGSGQTITWTAGSGVTVIGTATIANNAWRDFLMTVNGVGANAAVTFLNIGGGTV